MFELILDRHMIVSIRNKKNNLLVYVLIEDLYRSASLHKDFSHLFPKYYTSEEEFQRDNLKYNLIKLTIFPRFNLDKVSDSVKGKKIIQDFTYMAENFVEHKPFTDHCVKWEDELGDFEGYNYEIESELDYLKRLYNHILSFAETPPERFDYLPGHLMSVD
ncbi:hypothetical protein [Streptococcus suis]|nr:hypothetical protein [Streptococcus suis]NQP49574.1 hypothetical protein [Streptococcus suis]HEM6085891.1 hypothetical protein [Streptococcus suis]